MNRALTKYRQTNLTSSTTEKYGSYYRLLGVLADLALLNFCGYIAYLMVYRHLGAISADHINIVDILFINFLWFNVTQITNLYKGIFAKDAIPTIKQSLSSLILFALFLSGLVLFIPEFTVSHKLILYTLLLFTPMLLGGKIAFLLMRRSHRARLVQYTRVVIVGAGPVGRELKKIMESRSSMGYRVAGFFDDAENIEEEGVCVIGKVDECMKYVRQYHIKEIFCALPDRALDKINRLMRQADKEMVRFKLVPDVKDYFKKNVNVHMLGHFPIISTRSEPLENISNKISKRIFDVFFSVFVILFVLSWLFPLIALLIKLESKGPVLFKQLRSGKDNKPFYCLKFRSMKVNEDSNRVQARKNDDRITRLGAFMRRTSIDELPQFFNVLVGNMSVVGPRPHMLRHTKEYSALIDEFMVRHFLLPGITGWAQVSGLRGETQEDEEMEARVKADIWYMENWSMFLDLKVVFLTVWQVFVPNDKAY
jgi:putative colanic acid biosynthesis UDP-glucose lipid carrier transferase